MSKITQNAVLVLSVAVGATVAGTQVFQSVRKEGKKRVVDFTLSDGTVVGADAVQRFNLGATGDSVVEFLTKFNALPAQPRSGYDKYVNDDGFVNPKSPEGFSPQGVGKTIAKALEVAYTIIGRGGQDAKEMESILKALGEYQEIAPEIVATRARAQKLAEAIQTLGPDSAEADAIRKVAKDEGIELPTLAPAGIVPPAALDESEVETADDDAEAVGAK